MLDATCVPADVTYPTDLKFRNAAREKCERVIEILHKSRGRGHKKPRTYRVKARKAYLAVAKSKRVNGSRLRKALRAQLGFVRRDLNSIDRLSQETDFRILLKRLYRDLLVISELYRQQQWMYDHRSKRIDHRIVNISQPHIRPIKRGKADSDTEFGAVDIGQPGRQIRVR